MNFKNIEKWSLKYELLRSYVRFIHNRIFYKKLCVTGLENIPKDKPVFFAPNHQNALMDALIILCSVKKQPVFVARSDIFKNPIIARILIFLKILPAYRIRDGKENLKKNEELFNVSVKVLENKNILTLFPETTHIDKRRLRILKKGVQRIVFQTEEANDFKLETQIVPTGIYYSNYWNFRSTIQLNFGKPIPVTKYKDLYLENEQKAMLALRDDMTQGLIPQMIHIKTEEYYDLYEQLREIYHKDMLETLTLPANQNNKFIADKKLIDALDMELENKPESIKDLNLKVSEYISGIKQFDIRDWVLRENKGWPIIILKSLMLLLLSPIFIFGAINNIIPYLLPSLITNKLKDRQFTTSITFVFGMIFFPVFYLIQSILFLVFIEPNWLTLVYLISLPITGLMAFSLHRYYIKLSAQWVFLLNRKKEKLIKLTKLRKEITSIVDTIINSKLNIKEQ
ncbi:MAG: 1-acyl-sn-glycerol-3-phosphate acyltransferase [Bacteroidota bacterium]